jgi:hypothetical protein
MQLFFEKHNKTSVNRPALLHVGLFLSSEHYSAGMEHPRIFQWTKREQTFIYKFTNALFAS